MFSSNYFAEITRVFKQLIIHHVNNIYVNTTYLLQYYVNTIYY